jgi:hypothetical protein
MTPFDHASPGPAQSTEPASPAPQPVYKRSGSQKRQRTRCAAVWFTDEEYADAEMRAQRVGLSLSAYGRLGMIGTSGPRAQRTPHVHAELLARAIAALNKIGGLLNQIAHVLNAGGAISLAGNCTATLAEIREAARAIREAVGRKDRDDNQGEPA